MDKFQTELLAQFKEHNRLTKELVKIERANLELSKEINQVNSKLSDIIIPQNHSTEIFSAVTPSDSILWKYCPNCGMKMSMEKRGEDDEVSN